MEIYIDWTEARRKTAHADVTIYAPGSGMVAVNGFDLSYFPDIQSREQVGTLKKYKCK